MSIIYSVFVFFISFISINVDVFAETSLLASDEVVLKRADHSQEEIIIARANKDDKDVNLDEIDQEAEFDEFDEEVKAISDPIKPFNVAMFHFNDKLYFWVLKPVAQTYSHVVPEKGRVSIRRFFSNLATPIRFVNSLLQFKFDKAGIELSRFLINSTVGLAGFFDPAGEKWKLFRHREDFGQTLGFFGSGPGFYIVWPIFGPSSLRDSFGLAGDYFLDPLGYFFPFGRWTAVGLVTYKTVNETSLNIGFYEDIKKDAFDPYISIRDVYHQHRESLIKE